MMDEEAKTGQRQMLLDLLQFYRDIDSSPVLQPELKIRRMLFASLHTLAAVCDASDAKRELTFAMWNLAEPYIDHIVQQKRRGKAK